MEDVKQQLKSIVGNLTEELGKTANEIKVNFDGFVDVFGKEFKERSEPLIERLNEVESQGRAFLESNELAKNAQAEIAALAKIAKAQVDNALNLFQDAMNKRK